MSTKRFALVGMVAGLLLSACAHRTKLPPNDDGPYRIGRDDVLDVSVWRDGDLSRVVPVRPDGFISLPMVGDLQADGKTTQELANEIKAKLTPYIQEPRVTVMVREVNSSRVYVTGEVANPGAYPLRGRISPVQAIALAGGLSEFADPDSIILIRNGKDGGRYPIRYTDFLDESDQKKGFEFYLRPGDTLVVP